MLARIHISQPEPALIAFCVRRCDPVGESSVKQSAAALSDDALIRGRSGPKSWTQLWREVRAVRVAPIELGPNSVAWFKAEIDAWKASRPRRAYGTAQPTLDTVATAAYAKPTGKVP